jgi:Uma2 family endonuclease
MAERVVLNYSDYAALPDNGRRYELHDGELSVTPAPGMSHQSATGNIYALLRSHVTQRPGLGAVFVSPFDVILDVDTETTVVQPDVVYVDPSLRHRLRERGVEGAPTLVVEVLSPSTATIDRRTKLRLYARYDVPYYWIVDPGVRTIEAYELDGDAYRLALAATGHAPVHLPPFPDLPIVPASVFRLPFDDA